QVPQLLPALDRPCDCFVQFHEKRSLSEQYLAATRGAVSWQHVIHVQLQGAVDHLRPVADVAVCREIVWPVRYCVARAQTLFLWQIHEAVPARVSPAEETKFYAPCSIRHHVWRILERFLRRLRSVAFQIRDVWPRFRGIAPTRRFVAFHLVRD